MTASATPRPSATICLLRDGAEGLEVLMGKRGSSAKFMADAWVFPGGRVDEVDRARAVDLVAGDNDPEQLPWILAALREMVEEAGVWLTAQPRVEPLGDRKVYEVLDSAGETFVAEVRYFANWVTPADLPIRYDTRFYAAVVTDEIVPAPDLAEIELAEWVRPGEAILKAARGEWLIPFPTHVTLAQLSKVATATEFMEIAAGLDIETIQPRIRVEVDGSLRIVMPGESGFEDLPEATGDFEALAQAARRAKGTRAEIVELG